MHEDYHREVYSVLVSFLLRFHISSLPEVLSISLFADDLAMLMQSEQKEWAEAKVQDFLKVQLTH